MASPYGGSSRYAPSQTATASRSEEPDWLSEWAVNAVENTGHYGKQFLDWFTGAPPEGKTKAQVWVDAAGSEDERARRIAQAPTVFGQNVATENPEMFAGAQSYPLPGEGTAEGMSVMPEWQAQELSAPVAAPAAPQTTQPSATDEPPGLTIPGMASIKGKLGKYERDLGAFRTEQKKGFEAERLAYEKEEQRIERESEAAFARSKMQNAEGALNTATQKLATWEINPQRAFPDAFSKIAAVISVAMGAYAQGLSGGKMPNTALQIVNSAIDRDIDAQKMEYQKLKGLVDEKRNVYGMAMRLLGDERQADELARSAAYRAFNTKMTSLAKQYGIDEAVFRDRLGSLGLEEKENFHRASLIQAALKGSTDKNSKSSKVLKQAVVAQGAIRDFRKTWADVDWRNVFSQYVPYAETHAAKIEQKQGLLAKQLLRLTENGRISNEDFEIMLKYVPSNKDSKAKGEMYLTSLEASMERVISAEWPDLRPDQRRDFLRGQARGAGLSEGEIFRTGEGDQNPDFWREQFGKEKVEG